MARVSMGDAECPTVLPVGVDRLPCGILDMLWQGRYSTVAWWCWEGAGVSLVARGELYFLLARLWRPNCSVLVRVA